MTFNKLVTKMTGNFWTHEDEFRTDIFNAGFGIVEMNKSICVLEDRNGKTHDLHIVTAGKTIAVQ